MPWPAALAAVGGRVAAALTGKTATAAATGFSLASMNPFSGGGGNGGGGGGGGNDQPALKDMDPALLGGIAIAAVLAFGVISR